MDISLDSRALEWQAKARAFAEAESGSGEVIETQAARSAGGYRINGEKYFVTSANHADYFILQAGLRCANGVRSHNAHSEG